MTKIDEAVRYISEGMNVHAAAKKANVAPGHVYTYLKRQREKMASGAIEMCPCCKRPLTPEKT